MKFLLKPLALGLLASVTIVPSMAATTTKANAPTPVNGNYLDGVVAVVNDTAILQSQLDMAVKRATAQLKAQNQALPPKDILYQQVLDSIVTRQIQLDLIKRQGLAADDNQVNAALSKIAKQNGAASLSEFQQALDKQQPGSYKALRQQISEDMAIQALQQQQLTRRVKISEQDIDSFLKSPESNALEQSEYRTLHIRVPFVTGNATNAQKQQALTVATQIAKDLQVANPDVDAIIKVAQQRYAGQIQGGDMGFHPASGLPTELAKDIVQLSVGGVSRPLVTPEGVNVIKLLDKRGGERKVIEQWQTRHILISPSASVSPEMAKQQIDSIYEQLRKGADFATLASTYSKDPGSANNGGALGWVSEGEMVAPFEAMMKKTSVNDFSVPFETQFGWHILKVDAKREQDVTDTYRRNVAREVLYQRLAPQALEDWLQELRAQSYVKVVN